MRRDPRHVFSSSIHAPTNVLVLHLALSTDDRVSGLGWPTLPKLSLWVSLSASRGFRAGSGGRLLATKTAQGGPPIRSKNGPRAPEHDPKTAPSGPQSFQGSPNKNIPKRPAPTLEVSPLHSQYPPHAGPEQLEGPAESPAGGGRRYQRKANKHQLREIGGLVRGSVRNV